MNKLHFDFTDFVFRLLGTLNLSLILAGWVILTAVFALTIVYFVSKGIRDNPDTPPYFDLSVFWQRRKMQTISSYGFALLAMRFTAEFWGVEPTVYMAAVFGLLAYSLPEVIIKLAAGKIGINPTKQE